MLDVFNNSAFTSLAMTDAFNKVPYLPGRLSRLGLFRERGVSTTQVAIEEKAGKLTVIPAQRRGEPPVNATPDKRTMRSFVIPHFPKEDKIMAAEVQNVTRFGNPDQMAAVQDIVNERLASLGRDHDITLEWQRIGALKGLILDADGTTTLLNLFTEFGVSQQTHDMNLDNSTTEIRSQCHEIARKVEDELGEAPYTRLHAFCGKTFFDDFTSHALVKATYLNYAEAADRLGRDVRGGFEYGGIVWEEYRGKNATTPFVADTDAYVFPIGVPDLFVTYFAPADFIETVNTIGLPRYAKQAVEARFQRWVDIHTQSNPLSINLRPRAVVRAIRT